MSKNKMSVNELQEYLLQSDSSDGDDEYFTDVPSPNTYNERAKKVDDYYTKVHKKALKSIKEMDDEKKRYTAKEEEAEKWKERNMDMLRKYSPEPDFPIASTMNPASILKMKTPDLKREIRNTTAVKDPKISTALAKQEIEEGLKNPKIKAKINEMAREQAKNDLSAFFGNPNPTYKSRKKKFHQYYGGRKTRRKRKSKYKVRMSKRKTRRRRRKRKTRRRVKKRKTRRKRKTRKAGNPPKQSEEAGTKGLTQHEIVARDKLLKKRDPEAWKQKRLNKLRAFNSKLVRQNNLDLVRKNLDLDMHQASDEHNKAFRNLRVSPVTTGNKDYLDESMEEFQRRMSPVTIGKVNKKTSYGGKKRKTRKRKMRGGSDGEVPPPIVPEKLKYNNLATQQECINATPSGVWDGTSCGGPGGGGKRRKKRRRKRTRKN
jgi:hypothetical protein